MADLAASFAKLLVADADRSLAFYEALGFTLAERDSVFARLRWTSGADLYLVRLPTGRTLDGRRGVGVLVCFRTEGVDALALRARGAGATVEGPTDQPWHTREIVVTDPDGYRLNFLESSWPEQEALELRKEG
ncbi:MAG: VOC family protein [Pseudomonadota bacterium]|nr:VOC family protein [Pseudomonadota bacterium]